MYIEDRNLHGRAIYTDGEDGLVSLQRFGDHCITNPYKCKNGFVLAMWIKIKDFYRGELCLATTGAEVDGKFNLPVIEFWIETRFYNLGQNCCDKVHILNHPPLPCNNAET